VADYGQLKITNLNDGRQSEFATKDVSQPRHGGDGGHSGPDRLPAEWRRFRARRPVGPYARAGASIATKMSQITSKCHKQATAPRSGKRDDRAADGQRSELIAFANDLIEKCRVSVGMRTAYYRLLSAIYETGRYDGSKSLINTLPNHITRLAGMLYSPVELKFSMDYTNPYPTRELDRAKEAAKLLSRRWGRDAREPTADILWGRGVVDGAQIRLRRSSSNGPRPSGTISFTSRSW
jgi:hypothetical protein